MRIARGARWLPPSPLDVWCRGALIASTALAALSVLLVLDLERRLTMAVVCGLALLWVLPAMVGAMEARLASRRDGPPADLAILLWAGLAAGLVLAVPPVPWAALLAWPHGLALARGRRDANAAVALGLAALIGLVAVTLHPTLPGATLSALLLLAAAVGGTWLHARTTRRRFLRVGDAALAAPIDQAGLARRSVAAALLVAVVLLASTGLELGAAAHERRARQGGTISTGGIARGADGGLAGDALDEAAEAPEEDPGARAARIRAIWPEELGMEGTLQPGHPRRMAEVRSSLDDDGPYFGPERPLYLRARAYDTLRADGLTLSPDAPWTVRADGDDQSEDGWTRLRPPTTAARTASFSLRQRDHRGGGDEDFPSLLLHTEPVLAVDLPLLRWAPGEGLYAAAGEPGLRRTRWTAEVPVWPARIATAAEVDARYLQVPDDDPRFTSWVADARTREPIAADVEEILASVLTRFATWRYSLTVGDGAGVDALEGFYDAQRGYCVLYAAATLLELRAAGVPCRVVSGYRVTRFRPEREQGRGLYEVDSGDAHAWVEVALADGSWRTVDPTPARALQAALAASAESASRDPGSAPGDGPRSPADGAADLDDAAAGERGATDGTAKDASQVRPTPAFLRFLQDWLPLPTSGAGAYSGYLFALPLAVLLHFAVMRNLRRLDAQRGRHEDPDWISTASDWQRLLSVLRGYGFQMRRGQTPREFARAVRRQGGPLFVGFERVVDAIYRRRWGGLGATEAERAVLAEYRDTIASKAFRRRWEEQTGGGR